MPESEILAYQLVQLERKVEALREELHADYLDRHQVMNEYIPRAEHQRHAAVRREWPLILFGGLMTLAQILDVYLLMRGH